jgi:hypothetical protein
VRTAAKFAADCAAGVGLSNCVSPSTPKDCPAGRHWSNMGGLAHCVDVDPPCPSPNTLEHDALGNPTCKPPVITYETQTRSLSCPSGQQGSGRDQERTVTYTNGVPSYGSWQTVYSDCEVVPSTPTPPPPSPTCSNGASNYPTCTPPSTPTPTCSNGASDYPTCTPQGGGYVPPPPPPVCSNGASNYPTCTFPPPPPPPPPPQCPATQYSCGYEQQSVIKMTVYTVTFSGPSCTAKMTTQVFYVDDTASCPYD